MITPRASRPSPIVSISPTTHSSAPVRLNILKLRKSSGSGCAAADNIYKAEYEIKYCVGCELEKTDSELIDGHCILHPNLEIERRKEENYYFKFSKFQDALLELYKKNPQFVIPKERQHEITSFVKQGLKDFSISRRKEKLSWGVPVPGDPDHVMYVWFDALVSYLSAFGWPVGEEDFHRVVARPIWRARITSASNRRCGRRCCSPVGSPNLGASLHSWFHHGRWSQDEQESRKCY